MFALLALFACDAPFQECDTMAAYSVNLTVSGPDPSEVTATYSVDGEEMGACDLLSDTFACGIERAGDFVISLSAPGYASEVVETTVEQGECHVVPQVLEVALDPVDCTTEVVASMEVTLLAPDGSPLSNPLVTYAPEGGDDSAPCTDHTPDGSDSSVWICGEDEAGSFVVVGSADGWSTASTTVEVALDESGCHVVTEAVTLTLGG